jgi:O-antigen ligase/polysaccharide polymerase Wzy-like membrane protein
MDFSSSLIRKTVFVVWCLIAVLIFGQVYVHIFSMSTKLVLAFHVAIIGFLVAAAFLNDLRSFLVFTMIVLISFQVRQLVIHRPVPEELGIAPFSTGLAVDAVDIVLGALFLYWLVIASLKGTREKMTLGHPFGILMLFWIVYSLLVSSLVARDFGYSVFEAGHLFKGFILFFYLVNVTRTHRDMQTIVYGLFAGALAQSAWLIAQFVTRRNFTITGEELFFRWGPEGFRSRGIFGGGIESAQMIFIVVPIMVAYFFAIEGRARRFLAFAVIMLTLAGILCTKYRTAGLSVAVAVVVVVLLGWLRRWISSLQLMRLFVVAFICLLLVSPFAIKRFQVGTMGEARMPLVKTAVAMIKDNWLLGVGINNYFLNIGDYVPVRLRATWQYTVHNEALLHFAETGIFGFLIYYTLMLVFAVGMWRTSRSPDPWIALVSIGLFAGMVGSIPFRMLEGYHQPAFFILACVLLALAASAMRLERERRQEVEQSESVPSEEESVVRAPSNRRTSRRRPGLPSEMGKSRHR